jgi:hypothetical protein
MAKTVTVTTLSGSREITAAWVGAHLSVHRPVLRDGAPAAPKAWSITHNASGLSMGGTLTTTKPEAIALAKLWNTAAAEIDPANPRGWRYLETWRLDVAAVEHRRIAELVGPVLPDHPNYGDVAAAIAAALDTGYAATTDNEAGEQYPARETVAADRLRDGADGLEMLWRGKWWPVPTFGEVEAWALDSLAETPDGRTVEPDAPDSWPHLLGVV